MGLYDTIEVYMSCPYCGHRGMIDCQTKDLGRSMYTYHTLDKDWKTSKLFGKKFRQKLSCFKSFPLDKDSMWQNQAEQIEARATVPEEYSKLKFVKVVASCKSSQCQFDGDRNWILIQGSPSGFSRSFRGKIKIKNGKLVGEVYDIEKDDLTERKLNYYKLKYPKKFKKLMKKYKHEPFVTRHWHEGNR